MLAKGIGAGSVRPPQISEAPAVSSPRLKASARGAESADTAPPARLSSPRAIARDAAPAKPSRSPASTVSTPALGAALLATVPAPGVVISSPPAATPVVTISSPPIPLDAPALSSAPAAPAVVSTPPAASPDVTSSLVDAVEDTELVVTIAPSDWALESPNALVGHRAQRVAVAPGRGPGGTLMVRPLAPGEVAPKGSIVAIMVAFEPDGLPLSRAG
jgi:hypothetical protein